MCACVCVCGLALLPHSYYHCIASFSPGTSFPFLVRCLQRLPGLSLLFEYILFVFYPVVTSRPKNATFAINDSPVCRNIECMTLTYRCEAVAAYSSCHFIFIVPASSFTSKVKNIYITGCDRLWRFEWSVDQEGTI